MLFTLNYGILVVDNVKPVSNEMFPSGEFTATHSCLMYISYQCLPTRRWRKGGGHSTTAPTSIRLLFKRRLATSLVSYTSTRAFL